MMHLYGRFSTEDTVMNSDKKEQALFENLDPELQQERSDWQPASAVTHLLFGPVS